MIHVSRTHTPQCRAILLRSILVTAVVALVAAPVSGSSSPASGLAGGAVFDQEAPEVIEYVGSIELAPFKGVAGTEVTVSGTDFPAGTELSINWNSVDGTWLLEGEANEEFKGREFTATKTQIASASVADDGSFGATFEAPVDYGFSHDVTVEDDGTLLNKAGFRLEPTLTVTPESGPVGTPITVRMEGVGWAYLENSWQLTYDNAFTGVLTSVTSGGIAEATIPATGEIGPHRLRVIHGAFTMPYLNGQQSPRPDRDDYVFDFEVTPGDAVMPVTAAGQALPMEPAAAPVGDGPAMWTDVASGPVGMPLTINGQGLEPGADVTFTWTTVVGNRISGGGWDEIQSEVAQALVSPDGSVELPWSIPDDLGGPHRLIASIDGTPVAENSVTITPSLVSAEVAKGLFGDVVEVSLKGVGWTETANIYNLNYDNGFLGYACGFNSQGSVTIYLPITGAAGWHYVDLYPGIYKGEDMGGVQNFRTPQLTFAADHPGERLPAFHLAFEVMPRALADAAGAEAMFSLD